MASLTKEKNSREFALRRALQDSLKLLGERTMQSMIFEMRIQAGIDFDSPSLSLEQISKGLRDLYGEEAAGILIEDICLKMDEIASEQMESNFHS